MPLWQSHVGSANSRLRSMNVLYAHYNSDQQSLSKRSRGTLTACRYSIECYRSHHASHAELDSPRIIPIGLPPKPPPVAFNGSVGYDVTTSGSAVGANPPIAIRSSLDFQLLCERYPRLLN